MYELTDALVFTKVDDSWVLGEGQAVVEQKPDGSKVYIYSEFVISPVKNVPQTPADPTDFTVYDMRAEYDRWVISFRVPDVDIDGNYLDPSKMELAVLTDGEVTTFTPEEGYFLNEEVDWMPYGFTDAYGGYDLAFNSPNPYLYIAQGLYTELGIVIRYTSGGETHYSNALSYNIETGEYTVLPFDDGTVSIRPINTARQQASYNIMGQRIATPQRGITIINGKKVMKFVR